MAEHLKLSLFHMISSFMMTTRRFCYSKAPLHLS